MSVPNTHAGVAGRESSAIKLEGFNVSLTAPDPYTVATVRIPLVDKNLLTARGFIREYKSWMADLQEVWSEKVADRVSADPRYFKRIKPVDIAKIIHVGRGDRSKIFLEVIYIPKPLLHIPEIAKGMVYSWLWKNALVIPNRPQSFYILSKTKLQEFAKVKKVSDDLIEEANGVLEDFRQETIEDFKRILEKYHLPTDIKVNKKFHPIYVLITPIELTPSLINRYGDPTIRSMLKQSLESYVQKIAEGIIMKLTPIMDSVIKAKSIRPSVATQRIEEVEKTLKEFGLDVMFQSILEDVKQAVKNPIAYRMQKQYKDVKDWAVNVGRMVSMGWE